MLTTDDYNHRWTFIRRSCKGIYYFTRFFIYEIPKFFLFTIPGELAKSLGHGVRRLYKAIPPIKEWPGILWRTIVSIAKGIKEVVVALAKFVRDLPKNVYHGGKAMWKGTKWLAKKTWRGIKAVPGLLKMGAQKTWSGIKIVANWLGDVLLRYHPKTPYSPPISPLTKTPTPNIGSP
jgi:hypothetical protein